MNGQPGFGPPGDTSRGLPPPNNAPDQQATISTMRGGLQLGPPGRWWDDKHFAKELHLRPEQSKKMDAIFDQNRSPLLNTFEGLQQEQQRMESLTHAANPDENALFAEIDRVALARAALDKANMCLLLQIRAEMTPDQIDRLEQHR
jgi:Spy/CpxP family protein refolding chaperone